VERKQVKQKVADGDDAEVQERAGSVTLAGLGSRVRARSAGGIHGLLYYIILTIDSIDGTSDR